MVDAPFGLALRIKAFASFRESEDPPLAFEPDPLMASVVVVGGVDLTPSFSDATPIALPILTVFVAIFIAILTSIPWSLSRRSLDRPEVERLPDA